MAAVLWLALALPAALAVVTAWRRPPVLLRWAGTYAGLTALVCGLVLIAATASGATAPTAMFGVLRADALSAFMLTVIGAVGVTATWAGLDPAAPRNGVGRTPSVPAAEAADPRQWQYATLVVAFQAAMTLAVLADNLGVLWVAVEFTTIATAFLVGHHRSRRAVEAAWKYVMLGSVGIAIAFLGVVLLYAATRQAGRPTLSWLQLSAGLPGLDPALVRAATGLAVLGFATKAGLAPMHSWLPDAHGQAPAPVSGLMSGVLLAVAGYAVLRVRAIADVVIGPSFMRNLLVVAALGSLAVAAALLLRQRDYKRMLAYSSIEHMGLIALAAATGGRLATAALLLHVLGHGLAKAVAFVMAGRVLQLHGSTRIADVHALLRDDPWVGGPFLAAVAALLGFPPFALFLTEVTILLAAWQAGLGWVALAALVLLLVVFIGLIQPVISMTLGAGRRSPDGDGPDAGDPQADGPRPGAAVPGIATGARGLAVSGPRLPVLLALAVVAVLPWASAQVGGPIARAAAVLGGGW